MNGYQADLEKLTTGAGEFASFAERAGGIAGTLQETLASFGACWGGDSIGLSFAQSHEKPSSDALGRVTALSTQLGDVGDRFAKTAETYRGIEETNAQALRRLEG